MKRTFMIIDDFLPDPMALRAHAYRVQYEDHDPSNYFPGRNARSRVPIDGLDELISRLVDEPLVPAEGTSHTKFRLALEGNVGRGGVHIDRNTWSGILYMTPDEHCQGGTDFLRHKRTDATTVPMNEDELRETGYPDYQSYLEGLLIPESRDYEKWEVYMHIPMKFNRLLLFRPWMFHDAGPSFGTSVDNGRLIYPLFYNPKL